MSCRSLYGGLRFSKKILIPGLEMTSVNKLPCSHHMLFHTEEIYTKLSQGCLRIRSCTLEWWVRSLSLLPQTVGEEHPTNQRNERLLMSLWSNKVFYSTRINKLLHPSCRVHEGIECLQQSQIQHTLSLHYIVNNHDVFSSDTNLGSRD